MGAYHLTQPKVVLHHLAGLDPNVIFLGLEPRVSKLNF